MIPSTGVLLAQKMMKVRMICWRRLLEYMEPFIPSAMVVTATKCHYCLWSRMSQGTKQQLHCPSKQHFRIKTLYSDCKTFNSWGKAGKRFPWKTLKCVQCTGTLFVLFISFYGWMVFWFYVAGCRYMMHLSYPPATQDWQTLCMLFRQVFTIDISEKDILVSVGSTKANNGVGRNVHFSW